MILRTKGSCMTSFCFGESKCFKEILNCYMVEIQIAFQYN
jgi:hypothetical protein